VQPIAKQAPFIAAFLTITYGPTPAHAESERRKELRTGEAQTPEPLTKTPLKAAMQNLFLQEDPFPQQNLQVQTGVRVNAEGLNHDRALSLSASAELGLADSWTITARAPVGFFPGDERGYGNTELSVLYSLWVSRNENFRLTTNLRNVLPSPSGAGDNIFAHDLSMIAYARWAPLHVQAVATLDVSYGKDIPRGPRARPEASVAAIVKLEDVSFVFEAAAQRELIEPQYVGALGMFGYPGNFEIGAAATLDVTHSPVSLGATAIVSYGFDPPD
jgi:hypothetical protein